MLNKVLLTPVDDLVEIIKKNPNCSVDFLSKQLKLPTDIIEKWLVVLEEFKILKITYKGFNGFVKLSEDLLKHEESQTIDVNKLKSIFVDKSKEKGFTIEKMQEIWPSFLSKYESEIELLFKNKARASGYNEQKIQKAWGRYREELQRL